VLNGEEIDLGGKASATPKSNGSAKRKNASASVAASEGDDDEEAPAKKKRGTGRATMSAVGKAKDGRNIKKEESNVKVEDDAALQADVASGDDGEIYI